MTGNPKEDRWIRSVPLSLRPPDLKDNTGDVDRVLKGIAKSLDHPDIRISLSLARKIPSILRERDFQVCARVYQGSSAWHVIDLVALSRSDVCYGVAVDIGTSTVVVRLLDLTGGEVKGETSFFNPQIRIGPDILTRIHHAAKEEGLRELQSVFVQRLNQEIQSLSESQGISRRDILGAAMAGNTAMTHFFLGLDPYWICREPYIPVLNRPNLLQAREVGLEIHPDAAVFVFPNTGSYFGGDLIAGILASGMNQQERVSILVDVGTNAEVVLGNREWLIACAGAAGPALEGGVARMGMMAGSGAIDRVIIHAETGTVEWSTIGSVPAVGICGSGLIDLVAQLYLAGMIDRRGKFVPEKCGDRLQDVEGMLRLVVVSPDHSGTGQPLTLSQAEIDTLMRSKAAMYTILSTVIRMMHLEWSDFARFYVAGTFGSYINPRSAIVIGMLPDLPLHDYETLGNTSLAGATLALLSLKSREETEEIRRRVTYVEMNVNQEFMNEFSAARFLPHTDRSLFPSVP